MVVPADWKELELSRIAEIGPGINKALSEMGTGSLYVTVEDIYSGSSLDIGRLGRISISRSEIERFSLQVGDLVLGKSSVKRDGIGYPNLFLGCAEPVVPSGFTYRVRPDKKVLSSTFLLQYLRSRPGRKWVIDNSQSSALTNINSSIINRYPVIVPPLKEQEAIAEALSDADAAIESLDTLIAKKRDVKQATMQQLLTGRTRLPGFTSDWKETVLRSVLKFQVGFPFSSKSFASNGIGIRLIRNADLKSASSAVSILGAYPEEFVVQSGDLLIGMDGDFSPIIWKGGFALLNQRVGRVICGPKMNKGYARYELASHLKEIELRTGATTVKHLSHDDVASIVVKLPPIKEQEEIAEALSVMDDEIEVLTEQVSKLRMVKEGMMQDLLTGKVRLV